MIWKDNLMAFAAKGFNSDEFKSGGLHETCGSNLEFGNHLSFNLKTGEARNPMSKW
jgi:hypothetical protein